MGIGAEEILARQEAMELARRKMQEQYDKRAQEFAIKQKEVMLISFNCFCSRYFDSFVIFIERGKVAPRKTERSGKLWSCVRLY